MAENPKKLNSRPAQKSEGVRVLPLTLAGLVCLITGVTGGAASWYLTSAKSPRKQPDIVKTKEPEKPPVKSDPTPVQSNTQTVETPKVETAPTPEEPKVETFVAPAGEISVTGGEVQLGGTRERPAERVILNDFIIAETEVTNVQFKAFLDDGGSAVVKNFKIPSGMDNLPVVNVTVNEAKAYCDWLGKKLNAEVTLPTEAEWRLAAGGSQNYTYPWGNEWVKGNVNASTSNKKPDEVKSSPNNRSPFGAYDMVGSVWEWTSTTLKAETGDIGYIIKGGAFDEQDKEVLNNDKYIAVDNKKYPNVGFRYVIRRK